MSNDSPWRDGILAALRDERWAATLESLLTLGLKERAARIDATLAGALVLLLGDPSRTRQRRAADALSSLAPDAPALADALQAALGALDPRLRWGAAYTIGRAIDPPAANLWPAVRETLALEDGDQRWAAAELTCKLARHHREVRDDVIASSAEASPTMRRMLLYCLRDLDDPELFAVAAARLDDEDPGVRLAALAASARGPRTKAQAEGLADRLAVLIEKDPDPGVRRAAAATAERLEVASPALLTALTRAAAGRDPSLARAATASAARLAPARGQN